MTETVITIGRSYEFHSTAMANPDVTPFSGQTVKVIRALVPGVEFDEECEPSFEVEFPDGHKATAFKGELNGWYFSTGQCVEVWKNDPFLAAQMARDAEGWSTSDG